MTLRSITDDARLVVCCGSGGVGKTTTAAAIALQAACSGRKALVITIDPAKRLAQSLGLEKLDNAEREIDLKNLSGIDNQKGRLFASMLDTASSLDALIDRIADDPEQAARIKNNKVYRQFAGAIAGSEDYVAMERLHDLMQKGEYELIVLDTPPTKNALDFLNAPNRLATFLDESIVKWFVRTPKHGVGSLLFKKGGEVIFRLLSILVGEALISDLTDFFQAFAGLYDGFGSRAEKVNALLRDPKTVFLLVTAAEQNVLAEAAYFHNKLVEASIPVRSVIVNRAYELIGKQALPENLEELLKYEPVHRLLGEDPRLEAAAQSLAPKLLRLQSLLSRLNGLAEENIERLKTTLDGAGEVTCIPSFADEIHDIGGLRLMNRYLFAPKGA